MTYLYQAARAWLIDWVLDRWIPLKAKVVAAWQKVRARNKGDR